MINEQALQKQKELIEKYKRVYGKEPNLDVYFNKNTYNFPGISQENMVSILEEMLDNNTSFPIAYRNLKQKRRNIMQTNIFIPKKLNVGFQNRYGTYTGKLAYIIYYDENNKLRKEKSWNSWRDASIPNEEYNNEPTSGFVLNKNVGDYNTGWNHRKAYCRVWDPRNFEFEITIDNLLYILANTSCIKGKGLEGEFVYGWQGTELILIPTCSPDYKNISEYTSAIQNTKKLKASDLKLGATYRCKDGKEVIFLGKHKYYEDGSLLKDGKTTTKWVNSNTIEKRVVVDSGEKLWFADIYKFRDSDEISVSFLQYKNVPTTIIDMVREDVTEYWEKVQEKLRMNPHFSPQDETKTQLINYDYNTFKDLLCRRNWYSSDDIFGSNGIRYNLIKDKDGTFKIELGLEDILEYHIVGQQLEAQKAIDYFKITFSDKEMASTDYTVRGYRYYCAKGLTIDEVYNRIHPCYVQSYLKNGEKYMSFGLYKLPKKD